MAVVEVVVRGRGEVGQWKRISRNGMPVAFLFQIS